MKLQKNTTRSLAAMRRPASARSAAPAKTHADPRTHGRWYNDACGLAFGLELIGERWSLLVIRELMLGARRFNELRSALPALSAKVLTERLEGLEASGIVERSYLPAPVAAQVYGLTAWGRELEPAMLELVRWALRSPRHDHTLPFTPVSFMLSMRAMIDVEKVGDLALWIAFDIGDQHFAGRLRQFDLTIHPAGDGLPAPDLRFSAQSASDFLPVFYGRKTPEEAGGKLAVEGDPTLVRRFLDLFRLPDRLPS